MSLFENQTAALYVRLSQEDRNKINKEDESESITNQQTMLLDYCKKNGFDVYDIYSDENWSGSDRERPEFNRMIQDARDKKFNTIICKTQSRFARDMEMIEKYINGRTLQQIQQDIHYEKRNTIIIHGRALWNVWQWMKRKGLAE